MRTNHLRELTWADFILLFIALWLIFAEGLTDITEFHFTYQDLIPVVFTKHSLCVCDCVCRVCIRTALFGEKTQEGLRVRGLPASPCLFIALGLEAGSQHLEGDALFAFISQTNWAVLQCLSKANAFMLTLNKFILAHYSFVCSVLTRSSTGFRSPLTNKRDHNASSLAASSLWRGQ